jgi:hypothetical protein
MPSSGSGEVQAGTSTKHGKDNYTVHFLCIYVTSTTVNTNLSHNVYLFLRHLLVSVFGHLRGVRFDVCSLYVDVLGKFAYMIKIIIKIKIFRSLKSN